MAELEEEEKRACHDSLRRRRGMELGLPEGDYLDGDDVIWPANMTEVEQGWREVWMKERMREYWSFQGFGSAGEEEIKGAGGSAVVAEIALKL
jgi:hypothetical protein